MKTKSFIMKAVLVVLFTVFYSSFSFSQTFYALKIDRNIRREAIDITSRYQPRLVMGSNQALEFQNTVARFLVKKKAIEEDDSLSPMAKYTLKKQLSDKESTAMADVLETYRWQEYLRIKKQIQPITKPLKKNLITAN